MQNLYLFNERLQFPVGAGFFHAGRVSTDQNNRDRQFRYIYDCGTVGSAPRPDYPQADLDACIDDLRRRSAWVNMRVDALFISHFHEDHVSGLKRILELFKPRQVFIPYTDILERVAAFAHGEGAEAANTEFVVTLIRDPVAAIQSVVAYQNADDGELVPEVLVIRNSPSAESIVQIDPETDSSSGWHGGDGVYQQPLPGQRTDVTDAGYLAIRSSGTRFWVLKPWVDPMIDRQKAEFRGCIADHFKIERDDVDVWLTIRENSERVINEIGELRRLLGRRHNFNVTSMSLFSGPMGEFDSLRHDWAHSGTSRSDALAKRIGWLATGDAKLREKARRSRFLKHFGIQISEVSSLALPHHGSNANFHPDLLTFLDPTICVVGSGGRYGHPHESVVRQVKTSGAEMIIADTDVTSTLSEHVWASYR